MNFYHSAIDNIVLMDMESASPPKLEMTVSVLTANSIEASQEKHVPAVQSSKDRIRVKIGDTPHPMQSEHYIKWIYVQTSSGGQLQNLSPGQNPDVIFLCLPEEVQAVFAYCNLHGLWKIEIKPDFIFSEAVCSAEFNNDCIE